MKKKTREDLTNYIMSVQSLIDRINIMEKESKCDFTHLRVRIEKIEKYEDMLIEELSSIYEK